VIDLIEKVASFYGGRP